MEPRPVPRFGRPLLLLAMLAAVSTAPGCSSALATAMYVIQGSDVDPEFEGLQGKRVAVVCRPVANLEIRAQNAAKRIARTLSQLLKQRVPRIEVIDHQQVAEWVDNNGSDEFTEIGRAMDADLIVGVDLERFGVLEGQTIFRGKANVIVEVYDCARDELIYEKHLPQIVYPPNRVVSASEQQEAEFRREFVAVVADQVGRLFYRHDRYADYALDAASLR
jgi:hypothetical protein